jgi:hypothetical protein
MVSPPFTLRGLIQSTIWVMVRVGVKVSVKVRVNFEVRVS